MLVHPLLFAVLPIVSLLSHNINDAPPMHALRPAILAVLGAALLYLALRQLTRDGEAASLITSITLALFFSYGHVYLGLLGADTLGLFRSLGLVGRPLYLAATWLFLLALAIFAILRARRLRRVMTQAFLLMASVALAFPLGQIIVHEIQLSRPWPVPSLGGSLSETAVDNPPPDIYLFILDGYGRGDVLKELFGFDNSPFLARLESFGFQVADQSRSNYTQTSLSVASMLNMDYLDELLGGAVPAAADRTPLARLIRWSRLVEFLEQRGYAIVGLPSGYRLTELDNADVFRREPMRGATTLERLAFETSALVMLQDVVVSLGRQPLYPGYRAHRERIDFAISELMQIPSIRGPKFVFVHLLIPHPPFVFNAQGGPTSQQYPFTLLDGDAFPGTRAEYIQGYDAQLQYVNEVMEQVLQAILQDSAQPPVIVIHGDHGPGSRLNWQSAEQSDLRERSSNLSAYYLPGAPEGEVSETMTPVNSFRLVLNLYFGADLELLPDRSFYSTWEQPYTFIPIGG
jgi:hypothetical protein